MRAVLYAAHNASIYMYIQKKKIYKLMLSQNRKKPNPNFGKAAKRRTDGVVRSPAVANDPE